MGSQLLKSRQAYLTLTVTVTLTLTLSVTVTITHALTLGSDNSACVTADGMLFTWGAGRWGRLGHGDEEDRISPCRVKSDTREGSAWVAPWVAHVGLGTQHTVCVTVTGEVSMFYVLGCMFYVLSCHGRQT